MALFKKKQAQTQSQQPMDLDAVMKKFDRESNTRVWEGKPKIVVSIILAAFSVFCLYVTLFTTWLEELRLTTFMGFIMFIGFLVFPAKKGVQKVNHMPWYDVLFMLLGTGAYIYYILNVESITSYRTMETYEIIIGIIGILMLAELCRRSVGMPILIIAGVLIVYYLFWGSTNSDFWKSVSGLVQKLFYSKENGILGTPVNVCSKFIVVFIIFGAFLERTGIADFFINIANALVGRFSGGPAKVAVVASAMEGMVSGSSVANTVGSGAVTIPLMKKTGYKPEFAAAAEASASTGGQIMPPIMGAAAFLMADIVGVPYSSIVLRAILPAVLYFAGVFIAVHLEAKKEGLRGLTKQELPRVKPLLKQLYLLLPLILLVYLVSSGSNTIQYAAALAIVVAILVSTFDYESLVLTICGLFSKKCRSKAWDRRHEEGHPIYVRRTPAKIFEALAAGGQGMITVAVACGIAGIVSGVISASGLAYMIFDGIVALAGNKLIVALLLTMLCCIILGMGVPTTANYCIMAATCAPILMGDPFNVPPIAAHFFVFYFGIVADLTPPVALAAYAGAAIAQANPMKTAFTATKLAIGAFIVPFVFALNPAMLFVGKVAWYDVALIAATSLIGIFGVSSCLQGWLLHRMAWYERVLSLVGGLLLIYPGLMTDMIGLSMFALVVVLQVITKNQKAKKLQQ